MVIRFIKNHFWKFVLFSFIGFCAFLIDWAFFNLFYKLTTRFIFSRINSAILSMIFNFSINRNVTFSARGHSVKKQIKKWLAVYSIALFANVTFGKFILILFGETLMTANIAFLLGILIAIPISFLGSLLWVFRKSN